LKDKKNRPAVVLVSGGLDSSVVLAMAIDRGFAAHALSIRYGQRHAIESAAAKRVCARLGVRDHKIIDIDLRAFGGSALTDAIEVPKGERPPGADPIPLTYVPARNTIFLSLALSWAEALEAHDIFIGVSAVDYSGYPDCRPEFIEAFEGLANLGTRAANGGKKFSIHAPLVDLTKGETVKAGLELGLDFGLTWSCYDPVSGDRPCGECESCLLRAKGFAEAGVPDPALS
jgi:7-cyano-7-deazaguanine synthase